MKLNSIVMAASLVGLIVAFWNRNDLPSDIALIPGIETAPTQRRTNKAPFSARWKDQEYRVEPLYDYDLTGLVVSFRHQDGNSRMHQRANDKLNMLDLCVVWGDSANNPLLNKISFWNGVFTCNVQTKNRQAWGAFDIFQLSNNHLISDDAFIRDKVGQIRVGDQIRVRGWLSRYTSPSGSTRGTSITREDTGDGACETIFVDAFEIVQPGLSVWRWMMYTALALLLISLGVHFATPHKSRI